MPYSDGTPMPFEDVQRTLHRALELLIGAYPIGQQTSEIGWAANHVHEAIKRLECMADLNKSLEILAHRIYPPFDEMASEDLEKAKSLIEKTLFKLRGDIFEMDRKFENWFLESQ